MVKITAKQEAFSLCVGSGMSLAEAYRQSYNVGENTKPETVWRKAVEVMQTGNVSARVAEIQEEAKSLTLVTIASITEELEAARKLAEDERLPTAMTGAIMGKAKVNGLLIDKVDVAPFNVHLSGDDAKL